MLNSRAYLYPINMHFNPIKQISKTLLIGFALIFFMTHQGVSQEYVASDTLADYALVIHGGAGTIKKSLMMPEKEAAYRAALQSALNAGEQILQNGGSSIDAIEATIKILEDSPLFNAGKGAVFTNQERVELDASFMDGASLQAGAISGVTSIKNPVVAARQVMEHSEHVMLSGIGAEAFADQQGLEMVQNNYFHTEHRLNQLRRKKQQAQANTPEVDHIAEPVEKKYGTVGAVALDKEGNLAAATSTGGMTNKRFGRVGDSPIIGAGTYANNETCAVSCTGYGEYFIRHVVAYDVSARMMYADMSLKEAGDAIIHEVLKEKGGTGGLISIDRQGNIHMPFNTEGMFRGFVRADGASEIYIYHD